MNSRKIRCKKCGTKFKVPIVWMLGVEIVLRCTECKARYMTGYKMGALLMAVSLVVSLAVANTFIYITSSTLIPLVAILVVPMWIYIGYRLRLFWLRYKRS